jgi:hypothetical protein
MPFKEALDIARARTLLPTSLGTSGLQKLSADIRERSLFSAKVRTVEHLSVLRSGTDELTAGTLDLASARLSVKQFLTRTGYVAPKGKEGGLQDFSSDQRINLQLLTNVQQAQGYGWWQQGQDETILDAFPAQEFLRVEARDNPRSDWADRWDYARLNTNTKGATAAGSGRMVALKDHPIWVKLSRFGTPYEPFDFNSGMGVEDVSREDAMGLGIIDATTKITPQERPFNEDLQASPDVQSDKLRALLEQGGVGHFNGGVFVRTPKGGS